MKFHLVEIPNYPHHILANKQEVLVYTTLFQI